MTLVRQIITYAVMVGVFTGSWWLIYTGAKYSRWFRGLLAVWLASPLLVGGLGWVVEARPLGNLFNLERGSWAFLLGDPFALALAMAAGIAGWDHLPAKENRWYNRRRWLWFSIGIGVLAGIGFHLSDRPNYINAGAGQALLSPTKIAHDFVTYPVLFGGLVFVGMPLFVACLRWLWAWLGVAEPGVSRRPGQLAPLAVLVVGIAVWFCLGFFGDAGRLNPKELHPAWDQSRFTAVPYQD